MLRKKTIEDIDLTGKRVLVRVDFNVPIKEGKVQDDTRVKGALPTINYLVEKGCKVILMSHLGRPKLPDKEKKFSLRPVAEHLGKLLDRKILFSPETVGSSVENLVEEMESGDILLLENTRYHSGEKSNDPDFARQLSKLADLFVNDAFGTLHRAHASTVGVTKFLPAVAGFLVKQELEAMEAALNNPRKPVVAIFGGAKVSDKIEVIERFIGFADHILIGGGMAYTFLKLEGYEIGKSLYDSEMEEAAKQIMKKAKEKGTKIVLPTDCRVAYALNEPILDDGFPRVKKVSEISENEMGLDIGPETSKHFAEIISFSNTIFWNGPMGVFENELYSDGTTKIAKAVIQQSVPTIVGGGDSVFALNQAVKVLGIQMPSIVHLSTGGGATLEYLAGKELPGLSVLENIAN